MIVKIIHMSEPYDHKSQEFSNFPIRIGRLPDKCEICYPPKMTHISRVHAEITKEGEQLKLTDLNTKNGTFFKGKKIPFRFIKTGDWFSFSENGPIISVLVEKRSLSPTQDACKPQINSFDEGTYIADQNEEINIVIDDKVFGYSTNTAPITIGKNNSCSCHIEDQRLCDTHMQIKYEKKQFLIKDLTGANIIKINNLRLNEDCEQALDLDDVIALTPEGPFFQFHAGNLLIKKTDSEQQRSNIEQQNNQENISMLISSPFPEDNYQKTIKYELIKTISIISAFGLTIFLIIYFYGT